VDGLVLHRSSGVVELDEAAMIAVRKAQPFPPVPDHVPGNRSLDIHSTFRYQIDDGSGSTVK
jgi:TonB family protein